MPTPATTALAIHAALTEGLIVQTVGELRALIADLPADLSTEGLAAGNIIVRYSPQMPSLSNRLGTGYHSYLEITADDFGDMPTHQTAADILTAARAALDTPESAT